jgi:hypothetical protein
MKNYKKIDKFTPICMLANNEQIQEIRSIFKELELDVFSTLICNNYPYLINWYANYDKLGLGTYYNSIETKVYETFDKETFLKACGIVEDNGNIDLSKLTPELINELSRDENVKQILINNGVVTEPKKEETYIKIPLSIITLTESDKKLGALVRSISENY